MDFCRCTLLRFCSQDEFVRALADVYEKSPWVPQRAYWRGPFSCSGELLAALQHAVNESSVDERVSLLRSFPSLAGKESTEAGGLSASSHAEHASGGLFNLPPEHHALLTAANNNYLAKFGFPFVICVRNNNSLQSILAAIKERTGNERERELENGVKEAHAIAEKRVMDLLQSRPCPKL
jgi:2-oxo-4-hydroxy-4-carboxy-5-ureidoimidazoline decarboxylase